MRVRVRALAKERRRFGYRRLAIMLRRDGLKMNLRKVYRLYREERLTVRKRGGGKRALGTRAPTDNPAGTQSALLPRLRVGCAQRRTPLPHSERCR